MAWNVCLAADNEAIQHLFSKTFEGRGDISVKFCESAEETLREIEESPPHLLIVSINLPDKDGYDLCGELKEKGATFPVLLIEDIFEDIDLERCLEVQTDGFIAKPFEEDLIAEKVDEVLRFREGKVGESMAGEAPEELMEKAEETEEEEMPVSEMAASDEEEDIVELTDLVMEEEAAESLEEIPLEEEEIPPSITSALEESVSELEKMEAMEEPSIPSIEKEETLETPAAVEPPVPEMDRKEIEEMVAEVVERVVEKTLEEKLPSILKESLARLLSEFSESLK